MLAPDLVRNVEASCLCMRVQRASRAIGHRFDVALRPFGLNNWQFTLLISLNQSEPPSVNGLARRLVMDRTTMTKNLRVLEQRRLLEIRPDAWDARVRRIVLTEAGRDLLVEALDHWRAANEAVKASIPLASLAPLHAGLDAIAGQ
jgi:DNA-binding MarR family transcriptional regulator